MTTASGTEAPAQARTWLALAAMALGVFVIANDFTALSVAIPRIEVQLHTTLNRAQWVINGYALVFGVLIVTGGRLADLFGRKRAFMAGAVVFGAFSLLAELMPNVGLLVACRALMGVGGAVMWPGSGTRSGRCSAAGSPTLPAGAWCSSSTCQWPPRRCW